jgi:hypothetical protein
MTIGIVLAAWENFDPTSPKPPRALLAPSLRPQNRRIIFGITRFSNRHNHRPANWALFHAVSEGRLKKLSALLRKLRIGKRFFSVLRHEAPAHIRRLSRKRPVLAVIR